MTSQVVKAMRKAVRENEKRDFVHRPNAPVDIRIYTHLNYDRDQVVFKAIPNFGGTPWFDYGFISIAEGHPCAEVDPMSVVEDEESEEEEEEKEEKEPNYRALVRFWGFVRHGGVDYALVDLFEKEHKNRPITNDLIHKGGAQALQESGVWSRAGRVHHCCCRGIP